MIHPINLGHSGARILHCVEAPEVIVKEGPGVGAQGEFLGVLGPTVAPRIYSVRENHYTMELLGRWEPFTPAEACESLLELLSQRVWNRRACIQQSFNEGDLRIWLSEQSVDLEEQYTRVYPGALPKECLTHGDPTIANGMLNRYQQLRLIDALPAKSRVPSWADVDMGKVLQSWFGWEDVLTGGSFYERSDNTARSPGYRLRDVMANPRAWFWLAVHCKRILPYTKLQEVQDWCEQIYAQAMGKCAKLR